MNNYNFLLWVSESGSCTYSASFVDDASAIAYLPNLPGGTYQIIKIIQIDASTSYDSVILDQR